MQCPFPECSNFPVAECNVHSQNMQLPRSFAQASWELELSSYGKELHKRSSTGCNKERLKQHESRWRMPVSNAAAVRSEESLRCVCVSHLSRPESHQDTDFISCAKKPFSFSFLWPSTRSAAGSRTHSRCNFRNHKEEIF